jgi:hypothetical protein
MVFSGQAMFFRVCNKTVFTATILKGNVIHNMKPVDEDFLQILVLFT